MNCGWAFGLGRASIGEAVRRDKQFLLTAPLRPPERVYEKKKGLRKPRAEVIVPTLRQKRLGSSQPILAARLVLIRTFYSGDTPALSML